MKVSKRDISIVMVLLGVIALFCVYQFYYQKQMDEVTKLENEIKVKRQENEELLKIDQQQLQNDMTKWQNELRDMVVKYPAYYRYDDMLWYLCGLENIEEFGVHFYEYYVLPSSVTESYLGKFNEKSVFFASSLATYNMKFTTETYEGCKKMLAYIYNDGSNKITARNFDSITLEYDNYTGVVNGTIFANAYGVSDFKTLGQGNDTNYPPSEAVIPKISMGVECVFGPTVTPVPTLELNPEPVPEP